MKKSPHSQGRRIIALLKNRYMTYAEMQRLGISTSPHRRVAECLQPNERLVKVKRGDLVAWHVVSKKA